ncbi:MAG TPA: ribonuclease T [Methyloceanibacter sp.]|jgi:ribonuclease T2|nr:ribonuclease T [Methyloceanibacter sp.]
MRRTHNCFLALALALLCLAATGAPARAWRDAPGQFDYYALVLSWVPTYCRGEGKSRGDAQCNAAGRQTFLLHGLWPQYAKGWPADCFTGKRPWVPDGVIAAMRDIMPSKNLVIHEYRTHGTCSGLPPAEYFAVARALYARISVPAGFLAPGADLDTPEEIERAFLDANPWLTPDMISITCRKANLLDVRVCFGRDLTPRACGANEDQGRLCPLPKIAVPPPARP